MGSNTETHSKAVEGYTLVKRFGGPGSPDVPEDVDSTQVAVMSFVTTPAEILYEAGATLNIGNYESARITVGIRVPCYREEIPSAFEAAKSWVEAKLEAEVKDIRRAGV